MLDADTKRRIDTARDILVGKVPDPKSQVEQITIALIYKFMDDMDAISEELGGERSFFAGEFGRYSWSKLMQPGLGGHEMLGLYAEAIVRMDQNAGIPQLFRDIFSNAFLPYRDPETLRVFLKVIDGFTYDNSERLGDAFEYLLSVMDSQGNAGQFRTPRHIIDFIVSIVDPKKEDVVLDPACGTAGFLISSFKHILAANTDSYGNSTLTPDDRARLARNLMGYDISPDMVRLSLVNMYLHGLVNPHIYEYDTLTSEEHWNEFADVILANPPFMSPKGGIRPHNRFSVQSKRSEVLFVDYMAQHLNAGGRAGIIVPEGIIFQSQNAYKELRKNLVEECLVAVVSLPAGVFNPYSGVKTSILLLDKALARRADKVAFFKVKNDGFDLGAQRRPIDKNDLPQVWDAIAAYIQGLREGDAGRDVQSVPTALAAESRAKYGTGGSEPKNGLVVEKDKVAADGEYNLSGDRYIQSLSSNSEFPMVALGEVADLIRGITFRKSDQLERASDDSLFVATTKAAQELGIVEEALYHIPRSLLRDSGKLLRSGDILISTANSLRLLGRTTHVKNVTYPISFGAFMSVVRRHSCVDDTYLLHCLRTEYAYDFFLRNANTTTNISNLNHKALAAFRIPLPPLEVQQEIVSEIEGYQKVIDGARAVVENYRPHIHVDPDWPMVELHEICSDILSGGTPSTKREEYWKGDIPWITSADIVNVKTAIPRRFITEQAIRESATNLIRRGNIIVVTRVGLGKLFRTDFDVCISQDSQGLILKDGINADFLVYLLSDKVENFKKTSQGSTIQGVTKRRLAEIEVPLPPLSAQDEIVAEIDYDQKVIDANSDLVERFEQKIQDAIARVWGGAHDNPDD